MAQKNLLNYCQDDLARGSVLSMEQGTPIVSAMEFTQIRGNAYSFNVIDTLVPTEHRELGEDVAVNEFNTTKVTRNLMILTNACKVDRALNIMSDLTSVKSEAQHLEMVSCGKAMEQKVIGELKNYLATDTAGKKFTGDLSIDLLDDAVDHCDPTIIFVNNKGQRALKKLLKAEGQAPETVESFGKRVIAYGGVPVHVAQDLADNEVLMVKFAEDGVHGITNGGVMVYEHVQGVFDITSTEILYNVVCKTKNSFSLVEFTATAK